jgi:hypothetical protein
MLVAAAVVHQLVVQGVLAAAVLVVGQIQTELMQLETQVVAVGDQDFLILDQLRMAVREGLVSVLFLTLDHSVAQEEL